MTFGYLGVYDVLFSQNPNGQKLLKNLACEFPEQEAHFYSCLIVELKRSIARNKGNLRLVGMAEEYIKFAEEQLKQIDVRDQRLIEIELKEIEVNKREAELKAREIELENRERSLFEDGVMNGFEQGTINKTLKQDFYIYCLTPVVLGWIKVTAEGGHTAYIKKFCKFFNFDVKDNPLSNYGHASKSEKAYLGYANQLRDKFRKGEHYIESKEDDTCF